jgi:hypothetical protein
VTLRFRASSQWTRCWRRQSRANPSLKPNSLLAGKIQGILFVWASECDYWPEINSRIQWFTTQFPTHRNREFNSALQGINSGHQGIFSPDQGIPRWPRFHCEVKPNVRPTRG